MQWIEPGLAMGKESKYHTHCPLSPSSEKFIFVLCSESKCPGVPFSLSAILVLLLLASKKMLFCSLLSLSILINDVFKH